MQSENQAVADYRGPDSAVAPTDLDKDQLDETALGVDLDREGATRREATPPAKTGEPPAVEPAEAGGCAASGHAGLGGAVADAPRSATARERRALTATRRHSGRDFLRVAPARAWRFTSRHRGHHQEQREYAR